MFKMKKKNVKYLCQCKVPVNYLCHCLFFNKVAGLRSATLLKKRLWHRHFPVNFAKFSRTPFLQNTNGWLLLQFQTFYKIPWKILVLNRYLILNSKFLDHPKCPYFKVEPLFSNVKLASFCLILKRNLFMCHGT